MLVKLRLYFRLFESHPRAFQNALFLLGEATVNP